ncbi:hypothetical protein ACLEXA_07655 [Pseudescherichia vulneris]
MSNGLVLLGDKTTHGGAVISASSTMIVNKRNGSLLNPFTTPEIQLIGKYIHCSANWNPVVVKNVWLDGNKVKTIYGAVKSSDLLFSINRPNPGWLRSVWNMQGGKS